MKYSLKDTGSNKTIAEFDDFFEGRKAMIPLEFVSLVRNEDGMPLAIKKTNSAPGPMRMLWPKTPAKL